MLIRPARGWSLRPGLQRRPGSNQKQKSTHAKKTFTAYCDSRRNIAHGTDSYTKSKTPIRFRNGAAMMALPQNSRRERPPAAFGGCRGLKARDWRLAILSRGAAKQR